MKRMYAAAGTAALLARFVLPLVAAEPPAGDLSSTQPSTAWKGTFVVSNPSASGVGGCFGASDPTCEHYYLSVHAKEKTQFLVAIAGAEGDDFDLKVFYPDGTEAAASANSGPNESVIVVHRTDKGNGPYEVRVQPWLVTPGTTYQGMAKLQRGTPTDVTQECEEFVPDTIGLTGLTDAGEKVALNTLVLLDGVSLDRGQRVMSRAAYSYVPTKTPLVITKYRKVSFATDEASAMIQLAKNLYGGKRPAGVDMVYVLTNKDIWASDVDGSQSFGVAGLADCIGGVRFPSRAFAVGEDFAVTNGEDDPDLLGLGLDNPFFNTYHEVTEKIASHELGHLMGVHHHYANCVESKADVREVAPCTLLFPYLDFQSLNMGQVEQAVVRAHALKFAKP